MLGALRVQLQELKVQPSHEGILSTHVTMGTSTEKHMLHARMANTIVLLEGALVSADAMDRMTVSMMKGLGLNLATLPWEILYQLQDGIISKLRARENYAIQVLSEQKINMSSSASTLR